MQCIATWQGENDAETGSEIITRDVYGSAEMSSQSNTKKHKRNTFLGHVTHVVPCPLSQGPLCCAVLAVWYPTATRTAKGQIGRCTRSYARSFL